MGRAANYGSKLARPAGWQVVFRLKKPFGCPLGPAYCKKKGDMIQYKS